MNMLSSLSISLFDQWSAHLDHNEVQRSRRESHPGVSCSLQGGISRFRIQLSRPSETTPLK